MVFNYKKMLVFVLILVSSLFFSACSFNNVATENSDKKKISIVATIFPLYDFTKMIVKEKADVSLFLPPGVDGHEFEASAKDLLKVSDSDLFLSTGPSCEPWVSKVYGGIKDSNNFIDVTNGINFLKSTKDGQIDPHIWLDLSNAEILVDNILKFVGEKDPENLNFYEKNAQDCKKDLQELDDEFRDVVKNSRVKKVVFVSKFACLYFVKRYGLDYIAAYTSCDEHAEPSPKKISEIIDFVKNNNISAIFYEEQEDLKLAQTIANATGVKILKFNTLHTVDKSQFDAGVSYLDLMKENLKNLRQALC